MISPKKVLRLIPIFVLVAVVMFAAFGNNPVSSEQIPPVAFAANTQVFAKIDSITGESQEPRRTGAIDVLSFDQGVTLDQAAKPGSGKVIAKDIRFRHKVDAASPQLFIASASGTHLKNAVFSFVTSGGKAQGEYYTVTLTDVLITSVGQVGSTGSQGPLSFEKLEASSIADGLLEEVSLSYATLKLEYKTINPDGSFGTTITAGYDFKSGKKL